MAKSDIHDIAGQLVATYGWEDARDMAMEMVVAWSRSAANDADQAAEKWRGVLAQLSGREAVSA
jgi:hypothetical protein